MAAFIDPKAVEDYEIDGIVFKLRSLTGREKYQVRQHLIKDKWSQLPPEALLDALRFGLAGWEAKNGSAITPWRANMIDLNIDQLSEEAFGELGATIIERAFVDEIQKKDSSSSSPPSPADSNAAEKTPAS